MKKRIVCVLFLGMALLTGRSQEGHRVAHAGAPIENGNVNGDTDTDLSDAIYLLAHLFQGGPEPVECTPGAGGAAAALGAGGGPTDPQLPATGQTFCMEPDGAGNGGLVPCPASSCPGQDGHIQAGCQILGRFINNGLTVTDRCTGLQWQQNTADTSGDGLLDTGEDDAPDDRLEWGDALAYCNDLSLGGSDDWRLPNAKELHSIVDMDGVFTRNCIDDAFAELVPSSGRERRFWSSTPRGLPGGDFEVVTVDFQHGHMNLQPIIDTGTDPDEPYSYFVRAVRGTSGGGASLGGGGATLGNGDVNGDDSLDLSDAIYLLSFLFQGGSSPVPCPGTTVELVCNDGLDDDNDGSTDCDDSDCSADPTCPQPEVCDDNVDNDTDGNTDCDDPDCFLDPGCPQPVASELPATGVTLCYDPRNPLTGGGTGNEIPCTDALAAGQDGETQTGCAFSPGRYILNCGPDGLRDPQNAPVDDTIIDTCTGLEWQRTTSDTNGNGTIFQDDFDNLPWCDAIAYVEGTMVVDLGGGEMRVEMNSGDGYGGAPGAEKKGWRFPNLTEALSLMHWGREIPASAPTDVLVDPIFNTRMSGMNTSTLVGNNATLEPRYNFGQLDTGLHPANKLNTAVGVRGVRTADGNITACPTGACLTDEGTTCNIITEGDCVIAAGNYLGDGEACP